MKAFQQLEFNQNRWNQYVLSFLGLVVLISVVVECYFMIVVAEDRLSFFCDYVLRPTLLLLSAYVTAAVACRKLANHQEYILISAATLMADILIVIHMPLDYLVVTLHFPVILSLIYFQLVKLLYAILNSAISVAAIFLTGGSHWREVNFDHFLAIFLMVLLFDGIAFAVLKRGLELYENYSSNQENEKVLVLNSYLEELRSKTDPLTDMYNHSAFQDHLDQVIHQGDTGLFHSYLAFVDLDNFKKLNDHYGHREGDGVLRSISEVISSRLGPHDIMARYEGDKFAVQSLHLTSQEAFDSMEGIRKKIERLPHSEKHDLQVTVSIGLVPYSKGMSKSELLNSADLALMEAKTKGKNRTSISAALHAVEY